MKVIFKEKNPRKRIVIQVLGHWSNKVSSIVKKYVPVSNHAKQPEMVFFILNQEKEFSGLLMASVPTGY